MRLVYGRRALAQIEAILERIAEDNTRAAERKSSEESKR